MNCNNIKHKQNLFLFSQKLFPDIPEDVTFLQYYEEQHKSLMDKYQKLDASDFFEAFNEEGRKKTKC